MGVSDGFWGVGSEEFINHREMRTRLGYKKGKREFERRWVRVMNREKTGEGLGRECVPF